jgi:hypothetical protein
MGRVECGAADIVIPQSEFRNPHYDYSSSDSTITRPM